VQPMAYVLACLALLLAFEGLTLLVGRGRSGNADRVRRRLQELAKRRASAEVEEDSALIERRTRRSSLAWLVPASERLELLLYRAGMPVTLPRLGLLSALTGGIGWAAIAILTGEVVRGLPGLVATAIPLWFVRRAARRRMRQFEEQLPEGLELLTRALRAGHGLSSGFQLVGTELGDPIGTEFGLVAEEVRLGLDMRDALDNLVRRVDNQDLPYVTTAVLIQRQTGGNLAELLDKLSDLLRQRSQFYGRVRALTAQGRGAALFLALWLPLITGIVQVVAPDYLRPLYENTWGHVVLATAALVDVTAYLLARRIADVEA
jgi:tight adherence protein B